MQFATWAKAKEGLEERIRFATDVALWNYDEDSGIFSPEGFVEMNIPYTVTTPLSDTLKHREIKEIFLEYKKATREAAEKKIRETQEELKNKREGTKIRTKLEGREQEFQALLDNIDQRVKLEEMRPGEKWNYFRLTTPVYKKFWERRKLGKHFQIPHEGKHKYAGHNHQIARALSHPFGIVEQDSQGNYQATGERMPLEVMMKAPSVALDAETKNWQRVKLEKKYYEMSAEQLRIELAQIRTNYGEEVTTKDLELYESVGAQDLRRGLEKTFNDHRGEQVTAWIVADVQSGEHTLITTFDHGNRELVINDLMTGEAIVPKVITTEPNLVRPTTEAVVLDYNPVFIFGQNILTFDYYHPPKLMGGFDIGLEGRGPAHKGQIPGGFSKHYVIPGRQTIDTKGWAVNTMRLQRNKLDPVTLEVTHRHTAKPLDHATLEEKSQAASKGDEKAAHEVNTYTVQDGNVTGHAGLAILAEHLRLGYVFGSDLSRLDAVGKRNLAVQYWTESYVRRKGPQPKEALNNLEAVLEEGAKPTRFEDFDGREHILRQITPKKALKGLRKGQAIEVYPLATAFRPLLEQDPNIAAAYEFIERSTDERVQERVMQLLESVAEYPYFELLRNKPQHFDAHFNLPWGEESHPQIANELEKITEIMKQHFHTEDKMINRKGGRIIYQGTIPGELFGVDLGEIVMLSGTKGKFGTFQEGYTPKLFGIADPTGNQGERCDFEKRVLEEFYTQVLQEKNVLGALRNLHTHIQAYRQGNISEQDLVFEFTAGKNFTDYSKKANSRAVRKAKEQQVRKGDRVRYWLEGEEMDVKLFGPPHARGRQEWSTKGSLSGPVSWLFDDLHREEGVKRNLDWLFTGTANDYVFERLAQVRESYFGTDNEQMKLI